MLLVFDRMREPAKTHGCAGKARPLTGSVIHDESGTSPDAVRTASASGAPEGATRTTASEPSAAGFHSPGLPG